MSDISLDPVLARLDAGAESWAQTGLAERARLLEQVRRAVADVAAEWVDTAARVKGLPAGSSDRAEEWTAGPYAVLSALAALARTLRRLAAGGSPLDGVTLGRAPGGRVSVPVLPSRPLERALLNGFRADVWIRPGVTAEQVRRRAGRQALPPAASAGVGVVLGAGNVTGIPMLDVVHELVTGHRTVALKLNPVTDPLAPVLERALAPLVRADLLRVLTGDAAFGAALVAHPRVRHVHITGSARTHDAIVWGTGPDAERRRAEGRPRLAVPITSELGGVAPVVVVPGRWSPADLAYQASHVATMRLHNGGANCIAGQVLVLSADWPQRQAFVDAVRRALDAVPARPAWYPGSAERLARAVAAVGPGGGVGRHGPDGDRLLLEVPDPERLGRLATEEVFAPALTVTTTPGLGTGFLDAAVALTERLEGTLGANLLVSPEEQQSLGEALPAAVERLRYGTVAVNAWTGVAFGVPGAPWGAFPGHTVADVGSGIGTVHNALLLDDVERTVLRGPFRPFPRSLRGGERSLYPTPPWFVGGRGGDLAGRAMTALAARLP